MARAQASEEASREFHSVLFARPIAPAELDGAGEPDCFADLNLGQIVAAVMEGREQNDLAPLFHHPLDDPDAVAYRHEVLRDLQQPAVRAAIDEFVAAMATMHAHRARAGGLREGLHHDAWLIEAIDVYCGAVGALAGELRAAQLASRALRGLRDHVGAHAESEQLASLAAGVAQVRHDFAQISYVIAVEDLHVMVGDYDGEAESGREVRELFARFARGADKEVAPQPGISGTNRVEERILELIGLIHPEPFAARSEFCARAHDFLDETIARFDREIQFYLGYLALAERLQAAGLRFCIPEISAESKRESATEAFDLALAAKLGGDAQAIVTNDFELEGAERIFVVSGPNNGGKTTFARMFGQLHYLASLGLPVPAAEAQLFLADRIHTHFERAEDIATLQSKFEDELVRIREILARATDRSLIVMNESFSSTSLQDARSIAGDVLARIVEAGALGVYVTFIDELATVDEATVSLVSQIDPVDPARRTFKVVRKPADGRAYAWAIAEKHGLTYERLIDRIGR